MATAKTKEKYFEAVGRRKTATARVRISAASKTSFVINDKELNEYFPVNLRKVVTDPFDNQEAPKSFAVSVMVTGGGINGQADAIRHGITKALVKFDESLRSPMKKLGFLKRDPRSKERRKAGLAQAARKRKQWSKR
ncbi:MAG: 30S ribosomal protein S9 [Candidatus Paceibacterota bacterium]